MKVAPGLYSLRQNQGGRIHAFLLDDGSGELTLIDTLWNSDGALVLDEIRSMGHVPTDLKHIVLTHAHRSHLGGLAALKRVTGATVYAHEWEADIIAGNRKAQAVTLMPSQPLRTYLPTYPFQAGLALGVGSAPPCEVDEMISEGDRFGPIHVFHAPGHTPGHLSFWWPERRALFAGDAIATWPAFNAGWPALNLNVKQQRATIRRMAELEADIVAVGHGEPITAGGAGRLLALADWVGV